MSARLERALLLLQQSRPADAEREVMLALAENPSSARAHAYLALSRVDLKKTKEALESANQAVGLAPDIGFSHYVRAFALHHADRNKEAFAAIEEAIRLEPENETHFALLASIQLALGNWPAARTAAEQGLALNPQDVQCANLRSMALVRLGLKAEAMEAVDFALEREPDNAHSHANQGWNCLHRNDPRRAQDHFREALRLNPDLEYARHGMLEALKARNPVYRGMLAYFLWMGRQSSKLQWAFIIGTVFGVRYVRGLAATHPGWGPFLWPLLVCFYAFIYLSWTAVPMFNLLLRFDRFGRLVLSRDERTASNWFGACVALIFGGLGWWAAKGSLDGAIVAVLGAVLSICVAITFNRTGRNRLFFALASTALAALGVAFLYLVHHKPEVAASVSQLFFISFLGIQIAANFSRR